jgi:hypothetical protein
MSLKSRQNLRNPCSVGNETASRRKTALAVLLITLAFCSSGRAEVLDSRYTVKLDGLRVGEAILHTTLDANRYKVAVSADVGVLLVNTNIRAEASGSRTGAKLKPERFQLVLSGAEEGAVGVNFAGLAAAGAKTPSHLRGVLDPLTALLLTSLKPSSPSKNPCNNVLRIYTGHDRFDLSLRPKPSSEMQREPIVVTCQVQYSATAGDPQAAGNGAGGSQNLDWEMGFMKLSKPQFWLPEHLSLPTRKGMVTIDRTETAISGS